VEKLYLLAVVQEEEKAKEGMVVDKRYLNENNLFKTITSTVS